MSDDTATPSEAATVRTRRCWRCLQEFPLEPGDPLATDEITRPAEWWVCEACHTALFPRP